ncbi:MAG: hypothetical protein E7399_00435 [Ruminococcaceae bacterium]|nr:hypothetical protein [Oscillospiraceae bacterium]
MKLKKGISLLLVLALSLMSFAFVVSADADTAKLTLVADKDTTTLKAGDTFNLAIKLEDIAAKEFRSAQVAVYFNPEVLEVASTKAKDALIECDNFYDEDEEEGYGSRVSFSADNTKGLVMYAFGKHKDSTEESIACADGTFTVVQVRFNVKATGATGLQVAVKDEAPEAFDTFPAGYKVNLGDAEALADITLVDPAIRIGVATITEVTNPAEPVNVDVDTALEDVVKELPAKVQVKYDDDSVSDAAVTWACDAYDAEIPGEYTFVGTVEGTDKTASAKVVVNKVEIAEAVAGSVNVPFGATAEQVEALLPATATVKLANDKEVEVPVTWTYTYEAGVTTGDVAAEGALDLGAKYLNTAEVKGAFTLKISAKIEEATEGTVETTFADVTVPYEAGASKEDVIATLANVVDVKVGDATVAAFVTWDSADYDAAKAGEYTFVGTITAPENVTLDSDTIEVKVTVEEAIEKVVAKVTDVLEDKTTKTSSTLKLISLFPATVNVEYQDGTVGTESIVWDDASKDFNAKTKGTYTLTGKVGDVTVTAKVTVEGADPLQPPIVETNDVYIYMSNKVVNGTTKTMLTGQVVQLKASESVTWASSNSSIGMITKDGKLVANNPGVVEITAYGATSAASFKVQIALNPSTVVTLGGEEDDDIEPLVIPFTDLGDYSWATRMICELAADGIVSGKSATLYAPADNVTRAEFASLLVRALKLTSNEAGADFTDVNEGDWYYNTVKTASALGIVSGYGDGTFGPNDSITREQMAVMAQHAAEVAGVVLPTLVNVNFSDIDEISGYAKDSVNLLACAQIINGMGDGNFAPKATANRAQAAVIIYKLCEL